MLYFPSLRNHSILCLILYVSFVVDGFSDNYKYFQSSTQPIDKGFRSVAQILLRSNYNPGSFKTTPQMIQRYGYPSETHKVVTVDGYILTLHRIPYGRQEYYYGSRSWGPRPVVFLQHGLFTSSFEWFMNTPDRLLSLRLADAGYDVWLANSRGTTYSREHVKMTVKDRAYWEFSMNEIGKYDLSAEIDYVLNTTQQAQLYYIGSSMGTSEFWILNSYKPEYNKKFRMMIGIAPVAYMRNSPGVVKIVSAFYKILLWLVEPIIRGEIIPPWLLTIYNAVFGALCSNLYITETLCVNIIFLAAGYSLPQQQMNQLPLFFSNSPAPVSSRTIAHLAQLINTGEFKEYDFGRQRNLLVYGQPCPPKYYLNRTTVPTALIYSGNTDSVINPNDVELAVKELPNVIFHARVNSSTWNHFDYHLGRDVNELVNDHILKLLTLY